MSRLGDVLWVLAIALLLTTAHHLDVRVDDAHGEWAESTELMQAQRAALEMQRRERAAIELCDEAVGPNSAPVFDEDGALHCTTRLGLLRHASLRGKP